ncbi:MAG: cytochrome c peroxidase [Alteromonadaceae bacterium]|jgi:cytochrome c peroxidase
MITKTTVLKKCITVSLLFFLSTFIVAQAAHGPGGDDNGPGGGGNGPGGGGNGPGGGGNGPGGGGNGPGGGGNGPGGGGNGPGDGGNNDLRNAQQTLQGLIIELELEPATVENLALPNINDPIAQLGKQLFFTKNLGGEQSAACVSCHHPVLGGGDSLSLPIGVNAVNQLNQSDHDLLGQGRFNGNTNHPVVPRNSPSVFNLGLNNRALFWDSRVERIQNGQILTPDSLLSLEGQRLPDQNLVPRTTLAAAQARFPVTTPDEMRGLFASQANNQDLRAQLTARFANTDSAFVSSWPAAFETAFNEPGVSFNKIASAIGEYERSMVFINNPWSDYLQGDNDALSREQKAGAVLFFTPRNEGGAGCAGCHRGSTFSSLRHHLVAFPQFGPGQGNSSDTPTSHDFGRENITHDTADRLHFRPPTLLNAAVTAPYGHTGAYQTLEQVVNHYNNPRRSIDNLFAARNGEPFANGRSGSAPFCQLPQISELMEKTDQSCQSLYPDAYTNSIAAVNHLEQARNGDVEANSPLRGRANLSRQEVSWVADFLRALTDPCVQSRECLTPWIIDGNNQPRFPDEQPLIAHDKQGAEL